MPRKKLWVALLLGTFTGLALADGGALPPAVITGLFTLAGVLIGALLTYRLALQLATSHAKREAGRRLREAFSREIALIDPIHHRDVNVEALLTGAFDRHSTAVSEFRFCLAGKDLEEFDAAWRAYYEVGSSVRFFDYREGSKGREAFMQRVERILSFTR